MLGIGKVGFLSWTTGDTLLDQGLGSCEDAELGQAAFWNPSFGLGPQRASISFSSTKEMWRLRLRLVQ